MIPQIPRDLAGQELLEVFQDLEHLSSTMNACNEAKDEQRLPALAFQSQISSAQARLLRLQDRLNGGLAECIRVCLLAFLATTAQLSATESRYRALATRFPRAFASLGEPTRDTQALRLWMMMVGGISVLSLDAVWFRDRWQAEVPSTLDWDEARQMLKTIMWVDFIHDVPGQQIFSAMNRQGGEAEEGCGHERGGSNTKLWATGWAGNTYELT